MAYPHLDFVEEFRLRRWAREHYVSADHRDESWHSVILDEMNRRDAELQNVQDVGMTYSPFVPLAPTPHHIDRNHGATRQPKVLFRIGELERSGNA